MPNIMGGGGSKAVNKSDVLTKTIVDVMTENLQQCQTMVKGEQKVVIDGDGNIVSGVSQYQQVQVNSDCIQKTINFSELRAKVATAVQEAAKAQGIAFLSALGGSKSQVKSKIQNILENTVSVKNMQDCAVTVNQEQGVYVKGDKNVLLNITQQQSTIAYKNCLADSVVKNDVLAKMFNKADLDAQAKTENPFNVVTDWIKATGEALTGLVWGWVPLVLVFVGIIALVVFWMFRGGGGGKGMSAQEAVQLAGQIREVVAPTAAATT